MEHLLEYEEFKALREKATFSRTKHGNLNVEKDGKTYELAYSVDGFVGDPYGIGFPGEDMFRMISKDTAAKKIWKLIKKEVEEFISIDESISLNEKD